MFGFKLIQCSVYFTTLPIKNHPWFYKTTWFDPLYPLCISLLNDRCFLDHLRYKTRISWSHAGCVKIAGMLYLYLSILFLWYLYEAVRQVIVGLSDSVILTLPTPLPPGAGLWEQQSEISADRGCEPYTAGQGRPGKETRVRLTVLSRLLLLYARYPARCNECSEWINENWIAQCTLYYSPSGMQATL